MAVRARGVNIPPPFDGTWSGTLNGTHTSVAGQETEGWPFRIVLEGQQASLFRWEEDRWTPTFERELIHDQTRANVVLYNTTATGGWVETWVIMLTHRTEDTLVIQWARMVNNIGTPRDDVYISYVGKPQPIVRIPSPSVRN